MDPRQPRHGSEGEEVKVWKDDVPSTQKGDERLALLILLLLLLSLVLGARLWRDSDDRLNRAKEEYGNCLLSDAPVSQCEQAWTKAQNAYWIP